jgi:hypothetical protein
MQNLLNHNFAKAPSQLDNFMLKIDKIKLKDCHPSYSLLILVMT